MSYMNFGGEKSRPVPVVNRQGHRLGTAEANPRLAARQASQAAGYKSAARAEPRDFGPGLWGFTKRSYNFA